jgi:hypothetical protein
VQWLGTKEVAFILAAAPELAPPPANWEAQVRARVFYDPTSGGDLRAYLRAVSYDKARLAGDVWGPFNVAAMRPDGSWDIGGAMDQAINAGVATGLLGGISYFCVVFTDHPGPSWAFYGGGAGRCYVDMPGSLGVWAMENLHVLTEFGDLYGPADSPGGFDNMDCACGTHPSSYTKLKLGWMDSSAVTTVAMGTPSATVTLHALASPLSQAPTPGRAHTVRMPIPAAQQYYLAEARVRADKYEATTVGVSSGLPDEGVVVYWIDESAPPPVRLREVLDVGDSFSDATRGVELSVTSAVQAGFTVEVRRSEPADCERIRRTIANLEVEIRRAQEDLQGASPGEKPELLQEIRQLQTQKARLREHGRNLGCSLP